MPVLPVSIIEPLWAELSPRLPAHPIVAPDHPLGCHRRRVPGRIVVEQVLEALVFGAGYERIARQSCSDRTIRRRVREWTDHGVGIALFAATLAQYDRMIGLNLNTVAVDGCITKAPGGGEAAGPSPVDRRKQGLKRSVLVDGTGIPLHIVVAGANRHDSPLLAATLAGLAPWGSVDGGTTVHLDRGYDSQPTQTVLDQLGLHGEIARRGTSAPVQAGARWVVERTHAWMNDFGKLRRCTERRAETVHFFCVLAAVIVIIKRLINQARRRYRWATQPTTRRLR